jgi:hypothetical protein
LIRQFRNETSREWTRMDANGREWTRMDANGREWTRMDTNGHEWTRIAKSSALTLQVKASMSTPLESLLSFASIRG